MPGDFGRGQGLSGLHPKEWTKPEAQQGHSPQLQHENMKASLCPYSSQEGERGRRGMKEGEKQS